MRRPRSRGPLTNVRDPIGESIHRRLSRYYIESRSGLHSLISSPDEGPRTAVSGSIWAAFLVLLIAGPWLSSGYLFGTDWPGSRHFNLPTDSTSAAPLNVALTVSPLVFSGEVTGKLLVLALLFVAGLTSFRAVPADGFVARAVGSAVYVVNPFVFGRLHYGQLFLLGAYALLPWTAVHLRQLLRQPGASQALLVAAGFVVIGVFSPHVLLIAGLLTSALLSTHLLLAEAKLAYIRHLGVWLLLTLAATAAVSAFWLIPLITGRGSEGTLVAGTSAADLNAFAAVPDRSLGLVPNLLGLYGFWAENSGRFTSMKAFVPGWPLVLALVLLVGAIGAGAGLRKRSGDLRPWIAGLVLAGAVALVLELGVSHPPTSALTTCLNALFVPYRGMRDAGKWSVLLALVYSQLIGLGVGVILGWLSKRLADARRTEWVSGAATGLLLALPIYYGNGLLFGMHGEIKPSAYPSGWYTADRALASDRNPDRTLFLPWHEYMSYSFVRNQNRVVASPAPNFFSVPVVVSIDPEVPGISPPRSGDQDAITALVRAGSSGQWAQVLNTQGVKYVLLARELDWGYFKFLDDQPGLTRVGDFGSIILYRNELLS